MSWGQRDGCMRRGSVLLAFYALGARLVVGDNLVGMTFRIRP